MQSVGGESDGRSRQLGRFAAEAAPFGLTGMNIRVIWRRDRYLRGSDHVAFQGQGYTTPPAGVAGINTTTLTWNANTEPNLAVDQDGNRSPVAFPLAVA